MNARLRVPLRVVGVLLVAGGLAYFVRGVSHSFAVVDNGAVFQVSRREIVTLVLTEIVTAVTGIVLCVVSFMGPANPGKR